MNKDQDFEFYDLKIAATRITDLNDGWKIHKKDSKLFDEMSKKSCKPISIFGLKSTGKTWFLSNFEGAEDAPHGIQKQTLGICAKFSSYSSDVCPALFFDTEACSKHVMLRKLGDSKYLKDEEIENIKLDSQSAETLVQSFLCKISSIIVYVMNQLSYENQFMLESLQKMIKNDPSKTILVIHNFQNIESPNDIEYKISQELIPNFNLSIAQIGMASNVEGNIYHYVLAKEGSPAGDLYNKMTIEFIQKKINVSSPLTKDILACFLDCLRQNLPEFYRHSEIEKLSLGNDKIFINSSLQGEILRPPFGPLYRAEQPQALTRVYVDEEKKLLTLEIECPGEFDLEGVKTKIEYGTDSSYKIKVRLQRVLQEKKNIKILSDIIGTPNEEIYVTSDYIPKNLYRIDTLSKKKSSKNGYITLSWTYESGEDEWE